MRLGARWPPTAEVNIAEMHIKWSWEVDLFIKPAFFWHRKNMTECISERMCSQIYDMRARSIYNSLSSAKDIYNYLLMSRISSDYLRSPSKDQSSEITSERANYCALLGYPDFMLQD